MYQYVLDTDDEFIESRPGAATMEEAGIAHLVEMVNKFSTEVKHLYVLMVKYKGVCTKFVPAHTSLYQVCMSMY